MVMGLLAKGVGWLAGPLLIPALVIAGLWLGGKYLEIRDDRAREAGERVCYAKWDDAVRQQQREAAERKAARAMADLEAERRATEGLKDDLDRITLETDALRALADRSTDGRCLSDGVLEELRRYTKPKSQPGA